MPDFRRARGGLIIEIGLWLIVICIIIKRIVNLVVIWVVILVVILIVILIIIIIIVVIAARRWRNVYGDWNVDIDGERRRGRRRELGEVGGDLLGSSIRKVEIQVDGRVCGRWGSVRGTTIRGRMPIGPNIFIVILFLVIKVLSIRVESFSRDFQFFFFEFQAFSL